MHQSNRYSYSVICLRTKLARLIWLCTYHVLFRLSPTLGCQWWRRFLLRVFGAKLSKGANIYPSAKVWAPWNLVMHENSCLASGVDCYNVALITLGNSSTVSQRSYLCTASHDIESESHQLIHSPITIESNAWVCAEAFVGPGVTVGEGAVLAARSVAVRDLEPWGVYGGNPAKFLKERQIKR
ncbi:putative colanic acid biosynthesis acetyltransferase WcaF [Rubritalea squalenifaciens DSM 18772]|uniref:Putative colanic acid biosynthesis acetyltransferase WcaF n=1 Tax=Rubritalea squalenifaciens DSM 18772 TaxID=1123071 RepID=A0A1M6QYI2_9BACT|nr:putative colanic acid biosynthesis acetyltransferase WcaF [Rubritalea squalenifaciens DSM 18772]